MPDPRTIELIHRCIDDAAAPSELAELEQRLADDAEARVLRDELQAVNEMLSAIPEAEPPAELVASVMYQVRGAAAPPTVVAIADRNDERERRRSFAVRFGLGIAAALAIGFLLVPSLRESVDPRHVSGTMNSLPRAAAAREIPIRATGFSGAIRVSESSDRVSLAIAFGAPAQRQVRVSFDPAALSPANAPAASIDAAGTATCVFDVTEAVTEVQLDRRSVAASSIDVSIRQEGEVFETTIILGQPTNF